MGRICSLYGARRPTWSTACCAPRAPKDMPVQQPLRYELALNLKEAQALGNALPQAILLRADRLIE